MSRSITLVKTILFFSSLFFAAALLGCPPDNDPPDNRVTVPDVVDQSQSDAEGNLTLAGLTVGAITGQTSGTVNAGNVISQTPAAGSTVNKGTEVNLVISTGPPGEMVSIPTGSFDMGDPWNEGDGSELPVHTVTLSAYEIGKYEVTNREYAEILNWAIERDYLDTASENTADAYGAQLIDIDEGSCQISWNGSQFVVENRDGYSMDEHPVVNVSWYGAAVFCNWLSEREGLQPCYNTSTWSCDFSQDAYHLPTEAQWERAAAWNGSYHYRYGNGSDSIDCSDANYYETGYCNPLGLSDSPYTSPVGYFAGATSPVGCYDMSGNAWEWCHDRYDSVYYSSSPETDPTGAASGSYRALRGGSWFSYSESCRSAYRGFYFMAYAYDDIGFRLAK